MEVQKWLRVFTSLLAIIPISIGLFNYLKADKLHRLFLLFIIYAFLTDMMCWYFDEKHLIETEIFAFELYSLIEFLFYLYYLVQVAQFKRLKKMSPFLYCSFIIFWFYIFKVWTIDAQASGIFIGYFGTLYQIIFSSICAFLILYFVEISKSPYLRADFWFVSGILFYCLSSFFLFALIGTKLMKPIWFIQNIINIINYLIFAYAFILIGKRKI